MERLTKLQKHYVKLYYEALLEGNTKFVQEQIDRKSKAIYSHSEELYLMNIALKQY